MKNKLIFFFISILSISGYSQTYEDQLKKLNEYLQTFNPETYTDIKINDDKVYFGFKVNEKVHTCSITISNLKENTVVVKNKTENKNEIKIICKDDKKYFYSSYTGWKVDHFRFFSKTEKDLTKIEKLVNEFIKSLP